MMPSKTGIPQNLILGIAVLCVAWGLKYHYSVAHAENLKWILAPTTALVEIITRHPFYFAAYTGYINPDFRIIIAPACAGVNFLIAVFCMSGFYGIFQLPGLKTKCLWLTGCAAGAFVITISVNAIRIWISIFLITSDIHAGWATPHRVHRMAGILIYFFFLSQFYFIIQKIIDHFHTNAKNKHYRRKRLKKQKNRIYRTIHPGIFPLLCYWIVAIAVPWLNAGHKKNPAGFIEHSLTVGVLSLAMFLIFFLVRAMRIQMKIRREETPAMTGIAQKL